MEGCQDWSRLPQVCGVYWEIRSVGKLINSINDLLVTRLVISSSTRDKRAFFREFIHTLLRLSSRLRHIPKWAGNKISRTHGNTNIFIRFAKAAFSTSAQSFVRLKIAFDMSQGRGALNLMWKTSKLKLLVCAYTCFVQAVITIYTVFKRKCGHYWASSLWPSLSEW